MENNMIIKNDAQLAIRNADVIASEINFLTGQAQSMLISYIIEIGKRLTEAKALVPHGEWGLWLKNQVSYSQSTATNYMKIYEEYSDTLPNSQALANLTYSKAVALLAVEKEEREDFATSNDIDNKSSREIQRLIKERNEANKKAEKAEEQMEVYKEYQDKAKEAEIKANEAEADLLKAQLEKKSLEDQIKTLEATLSVKETQIKSLEDNPAISEATLATIKKEAEEKAAETLKKKLDKAIENEKAALSEKLKVEQEIEDTRAKMIALQKQMKMSNGVVAEFKAIFEHFQQDGNKLLHIIEDVKKTDLETAKKLLAALDKWKELFFKEV